MTILRPPAVAGSFYPNERGELERQIAGFLAQAFRPSDDGPVPKALIAPHAGYIYSGPVAANAYIRLTPARETIRRVVLLGPSHRVAFRGLAVGGGDGWSTPLGVVPLDQEVIRPLLNLPAAGVLDAAHAQEHSLEVHVPFLQTLLADFKLVPVVIGDASEEDVAGLLDRAWGGPETLIVVSTDLSHFLNYHDCQILDGETVAAIERFDTTRFGQNSACGRVPVAGLLRAAKQRGMTIERLDVRNSGDTAGPRDRVVGYGSWALFEPAAPALHPQLLALARASIEHGLRHGSPEHPPKVVDTALAQTGAVFVTLKESDGTLRGCIGSPLAWRPLIEDVLDNAFKAAFRDPRFPPVTEAEWPGLMLSVSLLTAPEPMHFRDESDLLSQLQPGIDGLLIEDMGRRSLFLPSVWEQLPDKQQFLMHLKVKAGLPAGHFSATFKASRFRAEELKE